MSRGREEPVRRGQRHRKPKHRKRGSREGERRGGRGMKRRRQQAEGVERLSIQWLHNRAFVFHHHEQLTYVSKRHVPHEGSLTSSKKLYSIYRRRSQAVLGGRSFLTAWKTTMRLRKKQTTVHYCTGQEFCFNCQRGYITKPNPVRF